MRASLNRKLYFLAQSWRSEPVAAALQDLQETMTWDYPRLKELQKARLLELVNHAYRTVPYYRKIYKPWED